MLGLGCCGFDVSWYSGSVALLQLLRLFVGYGCRVGCLVYCLISPVELLYFNFTVWVCFGILGC